MGGSPNWTPIHFSDILICKLCIFQRELETPGRNQNHEVTPAPWKGKPWKGGKLVVIRQEFNPSHQGPSNQLNNEIANQESQSHDN